MTKHILHTTVQPRNEEQKYYLKAIWQNHITFCTGKAGTGKTHIAVGKAVQELVAGNIHRLVLVRPVVESGPSLGYLKGSLLEKMDPYIRPLYDEIEYYLPRRDVRGMIEDGTIEIAPLGMMRGRTFKNAMIILDEAQNASYSELKLFLTRIGAGSKIIITGDLDQSDIPGNDLLRVVELLKGIEGIGFITLKEIVRHPIITEILDRLN